MNIEKIVAECEEELTEIYKKIDEQEYKNSLKVSTAFWNNNNSSID